MDSQEMKTRSIRADETTLEKFKQLSEEFTNQGECLSQLISTYEISKARSVLPAMETDIADFQSNIDKVQQAFLHALELNDNAEQRIRLEFRSQLDSKDKLIQNLQERLDLAEQALENASSDLKASESDYKAQISALKSDNVKLQSELETARSEACSALATVKDKQVIINGLNDKLADFDAVKDMAAAASKFQQELAIAQMSIERLEQERTNTQQLHENALKSAELDSNNKLLAVKQDFQDKIAEYQDKLEVLRSDLALARSGVAPAEPEKATTKKSPVKK